MYRLNKYGEKTHPCRTPLLICVYLPMFPSILTAADCSQYRFLINLKSFPSISRFFLEIQRGLHVSLCQTLWHNQ